MTTSRATVTRCKGNIYTRADYGYRFFIFLFSAFGRHASDNGAGIHYISGQIQVANGASSHKHCGKAFRNQSRPLISPSFRQYDTRQTFTSGLIPQQTRRESGFTKSRQDSVTGLSTNTARFWIAYITTLRGKCQE